MIGIDDDGDEEVIEVVFVFFVGAVVAGVGVAGVGVA